MEKKLTIDSEFITLAQALKFLDLVSSGGQAKFFLIDNEVFVNDEREIRRGRKLYPDDVIRFESQSYRINK